MLQSVVQILGEVEFNQSLEVLGSFCWLLSEFRFVYLSYLPDFGRSDLMCMIASRNSVFSPLFSQFLGDTAAVHI